jgi:hypothetical protein
MLKLFRFRKRFGFSDANDIKNARFLLLMKRSPWQLLFYASLAMLTLWLVLKLTGVIQTPLWLEYGVPIISVILSLLAHYQHLLETMNKLAVGLASITAKVDHIDRDVEALKMRN